MCSRIERLPLALANIALRADEVSCEREGTTLFARRAMERGIVTSGGDVYRAGQKSGP